ncbi:MAG: hypothetical protein K6E73_10740 [Bacteroidales bacterium]|nr:hypothetical protein [Bacteroidales bacterium]
MANTDINIQGKFVSVTSDGIIAGSEQVDYTPDASGNKEGSVAKALDEHAEAIGLAGVLYFATVADMAAVTSSNNGHIAYCADTKRHYYFDATVTPSPTQGYWLELGGGSVNIPKYIWDTMTSAERTAARAASRYLRVSRVADEEPFTITATEAYAGARLYIAGYGDDGFAPEFQISTDDGATWTDIDYATEGGSLGVFLFTDPSVLTVMLRAKTRNATLYRDASHFVRFEQSDPNGYTSVSGNVMSLLYCDYDEVFNIPSDYAFCSLFSGSNRLTSAATLSLPATALTEGCYQLMFKDCTALTAAPLLPATQPAPDCYRSMFQGCTSLTDVSVSVWLNSCVDNSMRSMYQGCTALTSVTLHVVEATASADSNQSGGSYAMGSMFEGCTALTVADLRSLKVADYNLSLTRLFVGCTALTDVWVGWTQWPYGDTFASNSRPTENWLLNASATGTLHLPSDFNTATLETDTSFLPEGWIYELAS